ncbi:MAG: DUF1489 domain-containing protein [Sneathiellaceae bacterium]
MTVHLLKLCVGVDRVEQLQDYIARRLAAGEAIVHHTRFQPKRAEEVLDGGSLYWVIAGFARARQRILGLDMVTVEGRGRCCAIRMDPELVQCVPQPRRPHQGWRYLEPRHAPRDLAQAGLADGVEEMPADLVQELQELGLL